MDSAVARLLTRAVAHGGNDCGGGSMSCAVYDTAWVSMIKKANFGGPIWLFPSSYAYITDNQTADGGWNELGSQTDRIVDTAAALLALCTRHKERDSPTLGIESSQANTLQLKIDRASQFLQAALKAWVITDCDHVGFEIIIPALLGRLLENGYSFEYPDKQKLGELSSTKLQQLDFRQLESSSCPQLSILHSLEALADRVDFDKINHLKRFGSFMASPAATAASLIFSRNWCSESERYLRQTFEHGAGQSCGGFPSAFPSQLFELSWVSMPGNILGHKSAGYPG